MVRPVLHELSAPRIDSARAQVWAFYPETANRTLEEIDMLFASKSPFVWDEERMFAKLKAENPALDNLRHRPQSADHKDVDGEMVEEV